MTDEFLAPIYLNNEQYIYDPLKAGVYFGILGAGLGLGYATTKKLILSSKEIPRDVKVIRPMLIGALIGSTFGATASTLARKNLSKNDPLYSWEDVYDYINQTSNYFPKYAELNKAANNWLNAAETVGYFIPGVSSVLSTRDAVYAGRDALKHLSQGNYLQAGGRALAMLGNLGMAALGLVPFGGTLVRGGIRLAGKALPAALNAARMAKTTSVLARAGTKYRTTMNLLQKAQKTFDKANLAYQNALKSGVGVDAAKNALTTAEKALANLTQKSQVYGNVYNRLISKANTLQSQFVGPNAPIAGKINQFVTNAFNSVAGRIAKMRGRTHVPVTTYETFSNYLPQAVRRISNMTGRIANPVVSRMSPGAQQRLGVAMQQVGTKLTAIPAKGYTLGTGMVAAQASQVAGDRMTAAGHQNYINKINSPSSGLYSSLYSSLQSAPNTIGDFLSQSQNFNVPQFSRFQYSPISPDDVSFYNPKYYGFNPEYNL